MNCNECQQSFTEYSQQTLDQVQLTRFRDHLNQCPRCQQALQQTEQVFAGLDNRESLPPESQRRLLSSLQQAARTRQGSSPVAASSLFQRLWPSRPLWAAAYSCTLLLSGIIGGSQLAATETLPDADTSATALTCPVMSPASQWLPDTSENFLT